MDAIINYLWQGSICLVLLYGFYRFFLTNHTFFAWNRAYLMITMALVLIIPAISIPALYSTGPQTDFYYSLPEFESSLASEKSLFSFTFLFKMLIGIYFVGVSISTTRFFIGLFRIIQQIRFSKKFPYQGNILAVHPDFQPSSFFHYIFLPEYNPNNSDHQLITTHESKHSSYYHSFDNLFLQLFQIIFWFHPFLKMLQASLCETQEYQVDNEVIKSYPKTDYANLLVNLIISQRRKQLMNNFNQFQTKKRIMMMDRKKSNLMEKSRFILAIPLLALLIAVFSCERQDDFEKIIDLDMNESGELAMASADEIFDVVEFAPTPPGGMEGWNKYLSENLSYPEQARKLGIEGTVYLVFVVEEDGSIQGVEILRGIGGGCDEEAIRVIKNSPDWEPGKQRGRNVNVRMRIPIRFKLAV